MTGRIAVSAVARGAAVVRQDVLAARAILDEGGDDGRR